jgi:hypothetical protein
LSLFALAASSELEAAEHEQLCQILWHCLVRVVGSAMVDLAGRVPPGQVYRPYEYQSLLTSDQVSGFVHRSDAGDARVRRADPCPVRVDPGHRRGAGLRADRPRGREDRGPPAGPAPRVARGRHGNAVPIMGDGRHS